MARLASGSSEDTERLGLALGRVLSPGHVVGLVGELGAGNRAHSSEFRPPDGPGAADRPRSPDGLDEPGSKRVQAVLGFGVGIVFVYDAVVSLIILVVINLVIGLRVKPEIEREGLDIALHGETVQ